MSYKNGQDTIKVVTGGLFQNSTALAVPEIIKQVVAAYIEACKNYQPPKAR